jgi:hypothetical protein
MQIGHSVCGHNQLACWTNPLIMERAAYVGRSAFHFTGELMQKYRPES